MSSNVSGNLPASLQPLRSSGCPYVDPMGGLLRAEIKMAGDAFDPTLHELSKLLQLASEQARNGIRRILEQKRITLK